MHGMNKHQPPHPHIKTATSNKQHKSYNGEPKKSKKYFRIKRFITARVLNLGYCYDTTDYNKSKKKGINAAPKCSSNAIKEDHHLIVRGVWVYEMMMMQKKTVVVWLKRRLVLGVVGYKTKTA